MGFIPPAVPSRFWGYFRLVDACARPGCPICRCLDEDSARYLDGLLYEHVNDPATRARLHAAHGFCAWHANALAAARDGGLGAAILAGDLLARAAARAREAAGHLDRDRARPAWLRRLGHRWLRPVRALLDRGPAGCPACAVLRAAEQRYLAIALRFAGDPEYERALDRSDGFCVPHAARLVTVDPRAPALPRVLERCATTWERLRRTVESFCTKHDYRNQDPITETEARAWRLALELLGGSVGVFGSDLSDRPAPTAGPAGVTDSPPATAALEPDDAVETLRFEKARLERRVADLTAQLGEASSRAASLHYRLWTVLEDRQALELNLAGERGAAGLWERTAVELRAENERLRREIAALRDAARVAGS